MSEKSAADTYAASVTPTRIPKNPLLSASVTGLTIDDYPNKPLLLPAAPPIVHVAPTSSSLATIGGETKALVTVGKSSNIDSESLDEINLNTPAEETQSAEIDINSNPLLTDPNQQYGNPDSILSQAALSFSALPSVASTVLSTFSKRLYAGSNSREQTPDIQSSLFTPNVQETPTPPNLTTCYAPPVNYTSNNNYVFESNQFVSAQTNLSQNNLNQPLDPPKLYAPGEVLSKSSVPIPPLAAAGGQNTYRLTAKKKLYAPIPGLSGQPGQFPVAQSSAALAPSPAVAQHTESEERKNGLFSLSNLAPGGLLQNISGLVTGTVNSVQKPHEQITPVSIQTESQPIPDAYAITVGRETIASKSVQNFYNPTVGALTSTANFPHSPDVAQPLNNTSTSKPEGIFESSRSTNIPQQATVPHAKVNPINSTEIRTVNAETTPANQSGVNFFNKQQLAASTSITQQSIQSNPLVIGAPPAAVLPPSKPTNAAGAGSFRLQKGTKLYANPLTVAELAPVSVLAGPTAFSSVTTFNPYVTPENLPAVPTTNFFIPNSTTSVAEQVPTQQNILPSLTSAPVHDNFPPTNITAVNFFATHQSVDIQQQQPTIPTEPQQQVFYGFTQPTPHITQPPPPPPQQQQQQQQVQYPFSISQTQASKVQPTPTVQIEPTAPPLPEQEQLKYFSPLTNPSIQVQEQPNQQYVQQSVSDKQTSEKPIKPSTESLALGYQSDNFSDFFKPTTTTTNREEYALFQAQIIEPVVATDETTELFEKITTEAADPLEETIKNFVQETPTNNIISTSLCASNNLPQVTTAHFTAPPIGVKGANNPFRRNSGVTVVPAQVPTNNLLASFFTPVDPTGKEDGDFNIFSVPSQEIEREETFVADLENNNDGTFIEQSVNNNIEIPTLPPFTGIAPPVLTQEVEEVAADNLTLFAAEGVPPPIGFDNVLNDLKETNKIITTTTTNSINFFNQLSNSVNEISQESKKQEKPQQQIENKTFFDNLSIKAAAKTTASQQQITTSNSVRSGNEEQILQNFFNNPPLSESDANGIDDLNYAILKSGCTVKEIKNRSFSNIVEPASSEACSEFSELNNSSSLFNRKSQITAQEVKKEETPIPQEIKKKEINNTNFDTQTYQESLKSKETELNIDRTDTIKYYAELPEDILKELKMANLLTSEKATAIDPVSYKPAIKHWFFKQTIGNKFIWQPFSHYDSALLETSLDDTAQIVAVEGGRYDVNISERTKIPVYWQGEPIEVRRCSWFYKGTDSKYVPYEEQTADFLEAEYKAAAESGEWHKKVMLTRGEQVVFHGPAVIVHFQQQQNSDAWGGGTSQTSTRPRVVKRDLEDFTIEQGESHKVDHLLFMVHGIGSACDLRMRSVEEVVEDFRSIAANLVKSHYKNSFESGVVGRVEVLPISWHGHLHSTEMGIDEKLKSITLESIPKLRNFTNDTLLDVLFYTSPTFCQKIINTVATSLNDVYVKYCQRHPDFNGNVSLAGHSLGSLILFDLLCNQLCIEKGQEDNMENPDGHLDCLQTPASSCNCIQSEMDSKQVSYTADSIGTGQPYINYPQLVFQPKKFFALGSPIGMFITIRGIDKLGLDFCLPTCSGFYNIFHPFDPVAYRIEALVNPELSGVRPVLIPHHKGRKRMHLELKETMTRVSADLKQRFMDTFKTTFDSVYFLGSASKKSEPEVDENMTNEVNKVLEMQNQQEAAAAATISSQQQNDLSNASQISMRSRTESTSSNAQSEHDMLELDLPLGKLNEAKRVDYVLQEAPLEFFNDYIFALSSHVCYWDSADTILFVMKEIYTGMGVSPDSKVPQQSMTIERPNSRNSTTPHSSP